ncbi:MAG: hypothetical protein KGR26_07940 [Cyanobacteria bacterium REEB65]|nr:hypothetical protein [Cyanobacteria bacterium REEB65]
MDAALAGAGNDSLSPDDLAAYAEDSAPDPGEALNILAKITHLVREHKEAAADLLTKENAYKAAQDRVRVLETITIPDAMDEAKQKALTTEDGDIVERGEVLRASIPPANLPQAIMWLSSVGYGAIVKREIKLAFGKGEDQKAAHALEVILSERLGDPADKQSVHPQTLEASIREMLKKGVDVPMELLGAYVQPRVKIKPKTA